MESHEEKSSKVPNGGNAFPESNTYLFMGPGCSQNFGYKPRDR